MSNSKHYTQSGNCSRAAKQALGKNAKPGVDFIITKHGPKDFTWAAGKAKRAKGERKPRAKALLQDQPGMVRLVTLIKGGTSTVAALASAVKCEQHTVRGAISRLRGEAQLPISATRELGLVHYRWVGPGAKAADLKAAEAAAQPAAAA